MDTLVHDPVERVATPVATGELDLELRNLCKRFGDFTAVDGVSLKVSKGQFVSILMGANGVPDPNPGQPPPKPAPAD